MQQHWPIRAGASLNETTQYRKIIADYFVIAVWRTKEAESRRVRHWKALAILAAFSASIVLADDFKTISGKEYKNATVSASRLMASY
jgi:hypothetical protein